jgi:hypothetical protein
MSQYISGKVYRYLFFISVFTFFHLIGIQASVESDTIVPETGASIEPDSMLTEDVQTFEMDTVGEVGHSIHADQLLRGERLFYGLVYQGEKSVNCASCHNTRVIDTLNWNPSAHEVSLAYLDKSVDELTAALLKPMGKKMTESHAGIDLTGDDLIMLKGYMDHFAKAGLEKPKPVINRLILFILFSGLILLSLADLIVLKKVKARIVHLIIILFSLYWVSSTLVTEAIAIGRSQYYEPDQPIKFSHQVHATDNKTECLYCHSIAEYAHSAGIPSVNQCMNCHVIVREGTHSGRFEINKVVEAFENNMPVKWIRVHNLPHHVFFSHSQHVGAAGLECSECHGEVEQMHKVMQVHDLSMGWCLDCHRTTEVDIFNNEFYSVYMQLQDDVKSGRIDLVTARETGGTECMKCHY